MSNVPASVTHAPTIQRLEEIKRTTESGIEYWRARELYPVLGYESWSKFGPVIARAGEALAHNGEEVSHHIARTGKMVELGSGAKRNTLDYFLTRAACYLIAMNGDGSKAEVASAQGYFAIQTRRAELEQQGAADLKRLQNRTRVKDAVKRVNDVAKDAGVKRYGLFTDAGWRGFYGMSVKEVAAMKGLPTGENVYDHAGNLELTGNAFRMELAAERLAQDPSGGEERAIGLNRAIGQRIRQTMVDEIGHGPERLPLEGEPIKAVEARLLGKFQPKKLTR